MDEGTINPLAQEEKSLEQIKAEVARLHLIIEEGKQTIDKLKGMIARCNSHVCDKECKPEKP